MLRSPAPLPHWRWTDDTLMSASVYSTLARGAGNLDQDELARHLADHVSIDRGYGHGSRDLLFDVRSGMSWRALSPATFGGAGSRGNGAAMRVAAVGAWHAGDPERAARLARTQSVVTHAHPEAGDGAAAVAAAASVLAVPGPAPTPAALLRLSREHAGSGRVAAGLDAAVDLVGADVASAARQLGTGLNSLAYDTVPFALWSVAHSPHDYVETFWRTVSGLGDRDTTCAIAGALVTAHAGRVAIPTEWDDLVEPLPIWIDRRHRRGTLGALAQEWLGR